MKNYYVKDLMISVSEYATVSEDATLFEAVIELKSAQNFYTKNRYAFRSILVLNNTGEVVGKLSQFDILKALEPKYIENEKEIAKASGGYFDAGFLKSILMEYDLWNKPLDDICKKASSKKIKDFMYTPSEGEYIKEDRTLDHGIQHFLMGKHHAVLVTSAEKNNKIVGILRLTDVFKKICSMIETCEI
ncbi:MAG: CBS domain-containing protein [Deltaproteobacteria bacterium]|nr:CBS domain-containing protein [Deltaproteobacteria bacterium]